MSEKADFLKDCVVMVASDDFEDFGMILKDTERIASSKGIRVDEEEVADAVRSAIDDGLLEAFVLSASQPHSTKVPYDPQRLRELWYYVTPDGKQTAKRIGGIDSLSGEFG